MTSKERLILASIIGAQLGPMLDQWAVPKADQPYVIGWIVAGIPVAYHLLAEICGAISEYLPRVLARWFPPIPTLPAAPAHFTQEQKQ